MQLTAAAPSAAWSLTLSEYESVRRERTDHLVERSRRRNADWVAPPHFVRILRTKLQMPVDDRDERAIVDGATRIRQAYVDGARRGHLAGYWRATHALSAYRPEFAATVRRYTAA